MRVMSPTGLWVSRACECQEMQREERRLAAARIPAGYWECTLDTYETAFSGADQSQARALLTARKFVEAYPVDTAGKGLLFIGSLGVGKTHLAVGVLRRLLKERGARGIFCDYGALVKDIQMSFNPRSSATEYDLLDPILTTEVLVVDDLGAQKPTDWVWDNVALILNTRYNNKLTTIVTTNYPDLPPGGGRPDRCRTGGPGIDSRGQDRRTHAFAPGGDVHPGGDDGQRFPADREARAVRVRNQKPG